MILDPLTWFRLSVWRDGREDDDMDEEASWLLAENL